MRRAVTGPGPDTDTGRQETAQFSFVAITVSIGQTEEL